MLQRTKEQLIAQATDAMDQLYAGATSRAIKNRNSDGWIQECLSKQLGTIGIYSTKLSKEQRDIIDDKSRVNDRRNSKFMREMCNIIYPYLTEERNDKCFAYASNQAFIFVKAYVEGDDVTLECYKDKQIYMALDWRKVFIKQELSQMRGNKKI